MDTTKIKHKEERINKNTVQWQSIAIALHTPQRGTSSGDQRVAYHIIQFSRSFSVRGNVSLLSVFSFNPVQLYE